MPETLLLTLGAACTLYALGQTAWLAYRAWPRERAAAARRPLTLRRDRRNASRRASDRRNRRAETIVVVSPEDA
ncbi:MAG: hypothetical protein QNK04_05610 [Myxococcota bacterium]|nr:hypothetical protein [Myxococcota bacterium]